MRIRAAAFGASSHCFQTFLKMEFTHICDTLDILICGLLSGLGQFAFVLSCRLSGVRLQGQRKFTELLSCSRVECPLPRRS